jgi:DNA-binding transcriptional LysR family regulator
MDIPWEDVRIFLEVAERGSMSKAARSLRLGQPTVSRRLGDLEHRLGFALFERSVAGVQLTARGEAMLEPARNMATWAVELHRQAELDEERIEGLVRVSAPPGVAFDLVAPFASRLREQYPQLRLEVISAVRYVDLARREADLALRMLSTTSKDLVTLHSFEFENAAYAAPDYARGVPPDATVADIDWIAWPAQLDDVPPNPQLRTRVPDFVPSFTSDDFVVQLRACLEGLGAMVLSNVAHPFSYLSQLERLDVDLSPYNRGAIHLVAAKRAVLSPRVRIVADALIEAFG